MKDVEIFCLFEYRDICFNLEEKGLPSFRDPDKKQNAWSKKQQEAFYDLALCITLCNISTCLNTQTSGKILN